MKQINFKRKLMYYLIGIFLAIIFLPVIAYNVLSMDGIFGEYMHYMSIKHKISHRVYETEMFLDRYPESKYRPEVEKICEVEQFNEGKYEAESNDSYMRKKYDKILKFIKKYPHSTYIPEARKIAEEAIYKDFKKTNDLNVMYLLLLEIPDTKYAIEFARQNIEKCDSVKTNYTKLVKEKKVLPEYADFFLSLIRIFEEKHKQPIIGVRFKSVVNVVNPGDFAAKLPKIEIGNFINYSPDIYDIKFIETFIKRLEKALNEFLPFGNFVKIVNLQDTILESEMPSMEVSYQVQNVYNLDGLPVIEKYHTISYGTKTVTTTERERYRDSRNEYQYRDIQVKKTVEDRSKEYRDLAGHFFVLEFVLDVKIFNPQKSEPVEIQFKNRDYSFVTETHTAYEDMISSTQWDFFKLLFKKIGFEKDDFSIF